MYVNVLYGTLLPVMYGLVTSTYIRLVYKLRVSASSIDRHTSKNDYSILFEGLALICTVNLMSSFAVAIITYAADAGATMETGRVNEAILIIYSIPACLNPFLYTIAISSITG